MLGEREMRLLGAGLLREEAGAAGVKGSRCKRIRGRGSSSRRGKGREIWNSRNNRNTVSRNISRRGTWESL